MHSADAARTDRPKPKRGEGRSRLPSRRNPLCRILFLFALAALCAAPGAVSPRDPVASISLDDFDFPFRSGQNDFFADRNVWSSGGASIQASFDSTAKYRKVLRLRYDLSAAGSAGGWWEHLAYSHTDPGNPARDIGRFEEFRFRVRGEGTFTDRFYLEFVQNRFAKQKRIEIGGVTGVWTERFIRIPQDLDGMDPTRIQQVAVVLESNHVSQPKGTLLFDDFRFVDSDETASTDDAMLDLIERRIVEWFTESAHPATGLFPDRATERVASSVASDGFGLAALGIGAERGWIPRGSAASAAARILETLWTVVQGPSAAGVSGYRGFFYHMLNMATGVREWNSELSSIDSAILLAGVLFAGAYFDGSDPVEGRVRALSDSVFGRVDWRWMLDRPRNQYFMAWKPGQGFEGHWDYYTDETVLICLLAIGSGRAPSDVFYAWRRETGSYGGRTFIKSWWGSLFTHFFAHCWFPFNQLGTDSLGTDWFANSAAAAETNRQFCIDQASRYSTYGPDSWGLTACFGPGGYNGGKSPSYGCKPLGDSNPKLPNHDGTIPPYGAGSCIVFFSETGSANPAIRALRNYFDHFPELWGLYGFKDAYNLGSAGDVDDWYGEEVVGIDAGPMLVMIENHRTGLVWRTMLKSRSVQTALEKVFDFIPDTVQNPDRHEAPKQFRLEQNFPNPFNGVTRIRYRVPVECDVEIRIYDLLGRIAVERKMPRQPAGEYDVRFSAGELPSGVSFLRLDAAGFRGTRKLVRVP